METEDTRPLSERMEDVSRGLVDADLLDKDVAAEKYRELQHKRDEGFIPHEAVDVEAALGRANEALAEARRNLESIGKKIE